MILIWQKKRTAFLTITFTSIFLVLGKVCLTSPPDKLTDNEYVFPESVSLPNWQIKGSNVLAESIEKPGELIAKRRYQYQQNDQILDIEMRYVTSGDVKKLIYDYKKISSPTTVRQRKNFGYYGVGVQQQKAYLSACINAQGEGTFTAKQFNQNQPSARGWEDILPWLLGQEKQIQRHCMWAHLSISLNKNSQETAYKILENTWFDWYQYWQVRLPVNR